MENWVPIFVTIIAIIGGAIAYRLQKKADEKSELVSKRREAYKELLEHYQERVAKTSEIKDLKKIPSNPEIKKIDNILTLKTITTLLISSDKVAIEIGELRRMMAGAIQVTGDEKVTKFAKVILSMREDCFQESKLTEGEMSSLLPLQGNTETALRKNKQ